MKIKALCYAIFDAMWWTKEGWHLTYGNLGWEWLPTRAKVIEMVENGEIG